MDENSLEGIIVDAETVSKLEEFENTVDTSYASFKQAAGDLMQKLNANAKKLTCEHEDELVSLLVEINSLCEDIDSDTWKTLELVKTLIDVVNTVLSQHITR